MALYILAGVIFLFYLWYKVSRSPKGEPPMHPWALPLIGHAHILIGDTKHLWDVFKRATNECFATGKITTYNIAGRKFYLVTDPDDCLTISNSCLEKYYKAAKSCYGEGLVTASEDAWKYHRKLLNPQFNLNYINSFLGVFNQQSRVLVEEFASMAGKGPFDHGLIIRHNEMKTICLTSLGIDFKTSNDIIEQYASTFDAIFDILVEQIRSFWLYIRFFWLRSNLKKKRNKYRDILHNLTDEIIEKRKHEHNNNTLKTIDGKNFRSFLDILFDIKKTVGDHMLSDKEIRDHINTLILAGHDTVAAANQFTLLLIGSYPEVQKRIYEELVEVFGDSSRDVEKDDLTRLIYLEAVLKESLRYYTIAPVVARCITKDINIRDWTLKAGRVCILMLHSVHRHPMWGKDVNEFKPERWLDPNTLPKNANAFLSFSLGRRSCIGKTYAMISMKTTLVHILRNYRISADHKKMVLKFDCLLKAISGHYLSMEKR